MADKKKSILEEAILDAKRIQDALNANTKEILRSVAKEEIDSLVKESLEEGYVEEDVDSEEDVEVTDIDSEEGEATDVVDAPMPDVDGTEDSEEIEDPEGGDSIEGDYESGMDAFASDDEVEMDMTTASDEDVISVYKKLTGDDEIEVVVDDNTGDVTLNVTEPGEFVIKTGEGTAEAPGMDVDDFDVDAEVAADMDSEIPGMEEPAMGEPGMEEPGMEEPAMGEPEAEVSADDNDIENNDEEVMYEIALDEGEVGATADGKPRTATSDVSNAKGSLPSGDIDNVTAPEDKDSGDNLEGGFDDDAVKHANAEGPIVMSEDDVAEDVDENSISEDDVAEGEEVDEQIRTTQAMARKSGGKNQPKQLGGKNLEESRVKAKYNTLLAEAKELKVKNGEYKTALKTFRTMLAETVVFNSNLTYTTKLFMEHSTTKAEKEVIFKRFDDEVSTLKESKKLFKTIESEMGNKKPMNESIESKITKEVGSSKSAQLNESTAYVDKETSRIMDLMKRVNNR